MDLSTTEIVLILTLLINPGSQIAAIVGKQSWVRNLKILDALLKLHAGNWGAAKNEEDK